MNGTQAIKIVHKCLENEQYEVRQHFYDRMAERPIFWPDVQGIVDGPVATRTDGDDQYGRPRWFLKGTTADELEVEILIVFDSENDQYKVIFWTIYWEDFDD